MAAPAHGTVTYFYPVRSRGEPVHMMVAYGKVDMAIELISFDEWFARKGEKYPFLPYITQPDGSIMLETTVILKHIAVLGGKFVVDEKQEKLLEIANGPPIQLGDPTANLPDGGGRTKAGQPEYDEWFKGCVEVLKGYVTELGAGPFFAGATPGYAEPMMWHNVDNLFSIDKAAFTEAIGAESMTKLQAWYDTFAALEGIKEYLEKRPIFPGGKFGLPGSRLNPA